MTAPGDHLLSVGRVLAGRYELLRLLGRGGMAEVYAAQDRSLGREVAVKLLLERFRQDQAFVRRFQDEARHVARMNHPNLVGVFDTGTAGQGSDDDGLGQPFIVMELVEGRSLQEAIAAGGLTEDRALEVTADVCAALSYAHDRGVIHRDIKPGNILLAEDGTVKVTDFGIARAVDTENVTRTAAVLGTAAYLSPEQAQGLDVDPRSDLYSLGVVLYEALTGEQPFTGDSAVTVAYQHVQEPPRPPRSLDPGISPAAEAIAMRALAKNPANRYQYAGEMRSDLMNARVGAPVTAPAVLSREETALLQPTPANRPVRSHEQERRRRGLGYGLLAVVALLAVVFGVWYLVGLFSGDEGQLIPVPDVVNQPQDFAVDILEEQGFDVGDIEVTSSDEVEEGRVIRQRPGAGTRVEEGATVDLVVSSGQQLSTVPDIINLTENEARQRIRQEGLVPGRADREFNPDIAEGRVISSSPTAGEEVAAGSTVDFVVSRGEQLVRVSPVVNRTEADALEALEGQGLEVSIEREHSPTVAEGFVIRQDPAPGTELRPGDMVTIVVSLGPEEVEEDEEEDEEFEPPPVVEDPPPDEDEDPPPDEDEDPPPDEDGE